MHYSKLLHSLENKINQLFETYELAAFIKKQVKALKTVMQSYQNLVNTSLQKLNYHVKQMQPMQNYSVFKSHEKNNEKIRECLSKFIPASVIKQGKSSNLESDLIEKFKFESFDGLNTLTRIKKYKGCCENYKSLLISIGKDLLDLYNKNLTEIFSVNPNVTSFNSREPSPSVKIINADGKKNIVSKVNRLLNRGSLTKEEAKRMISSMNKSEISSNQLEILQFVEDQRQSDEDPLTETRVKPGENKLKFQCDIKKAIRIPKKINKSYSVLKRRRSVNSSFSRNYSSSLIRTGPNTSKSRSRSKVNMI